MNKKPHQNRRNQETKMTSQPPAMNPTTEIPFTALDSIAADCGIDLPVARARAIEEETAAAGIRCLLAGADDVELLRLARHGSSEIREAARARLVGRGINPETGDDPFAGLAP